MVKVVESLSLAINSRLNPKLSKQTTLTNIQEDDEMIIEEKVTISKSKKNRKEKAQGFEMT